MVNLGLQRRWAGRPGSIERAKKRLLEREQRKKKRETKNETSICDPEEDRNRATPRAR